MIRRPLPWFLLLWALFVGLRVLQSLGAVGSFDDEDGYTLAAAWELLHNPVWPYQAYQLSEWENGSLVTVLLTVPFCLLFGPSLFALKLAALTLSSVTLGGLFLLGRHAAGLPGAVATCLVYIFFPNPIYAYSVTAHGFHPDSMALQIPLLLLAVRAHDEGWGPRRIFGVGVLAALNVYFAYISVIAVVAAFLPWALRALLRRRPPRLPLLPLLSGAAVGSLPLVVFNAVNDFRGFQLYHGGLSDYVSPAGLAEKVRWFREQTLTPLLHFANPTDSNAPDFGVFEAAFWAVVLPSLLAPFAVALVRRLRRRGPSPVTHLDRVLLWFPALTLAIFFTSKHPIGPMHVVPVLVVMTVAVGVRLGQLLRARWPGRLLAVAIMGSFLATAVPAQLTDVKPRRFGLALALDGRNYPLFLYRARDVFDNTRPATTDHFAMMAAERRLDAVRTMLLTLRLEHAKNDEHLVHHLLVPVLHDPRPLRALRAFLRTRPETSVPVDLAQAAGLALMHLILNEKVHLAEAIAFLASSPPAQAAGMVEVLGFTMDATPGMLAVLASGGGAQGPRWQQRYAFGMGRVWASRVLFEEHRRLCGKDDLPAALQADYMRGVGFGLAQILVRPLPARVEENICPRWRDDFWKGARAAGKPGEWVLGRSSAL